jgi:L-threonylcarbamoyladenylate synthase
VIVHVASIDDVAPLVSLPSPPGFAGGEGLGVRGDSAPAGESNFREGSCPPSPPAKPGGEGVMQLLAERFWPGPLTLVLPKSPRIPDIVTAGGPTIAVRVPNHPIALELLRVAGIPLAAPSANPSTQLSPTRAEHVLRGLGGKIDLILDGGPTTGGIESTVLDVTTDPPTLLRPGLVTRAMLEAVVGPIRLRPVAELSSPARSPGQQEKHYAPRTPLEIAPDSGLQRVHLHLEAGRRVGWLTIGPANRDVPACVRIVEMPEIPQAFAACLYDTLHVLDAEELDVLVMSRPPLGDLWTAVHDRLYRAGRFSE